MILNQLCDSWFGVLTLRAPFAPLLGRGYTLQIYTLIVKLAIFTDIFCPFIDIFRAGVFVLLLVFLELRLSASLQHLDVGWLGIILWATTIQFRSSYHKKKADHTSAFLCILTFAYLSNFS